MFSLERLSTYNSIDFLKPEKKSNAPWVVKKILKQGIGSNGQILDVGCGAGFLSNALAKEGFNVTGVDLSHEKLQAARTQDNTNSVRYIVANPLCLPFRSGTFDVVTAMDFLESSENASQVIHEMSRVLKPGGLFFYHCINRNFLTQLFAGKLAEWFGRPSMAFNISSSVITPSRVANQCLSSGVLAQEKAGIRPLFSSVPIKNLLLGALPENLRFQAVKSTVLSHIC
ncbi:MAG: gamma-tocopherol methyltransferase [Pseudobdellovibrio sp.]|jgi:2-polyprenyl-6-hydroxyphenyl methylase/3-demethylubiquinone-9 3-methyltransferase|nr:gamma-tocopherol methyltransferase [Pseudobdellovibrio sp.]